MPFGLLVCLLILAAKASNQQSTECVINIAKFNNEVPMPMSNNDIFTPQPNGTIHIKARERISLYCPLGFNTDPTKNEERLNTIKKIEVLCAGDNLFSRVPASPASPARAIDDSSFKCFVFAQNNYTKIPTTRDDRVLTDNDAYIREIRFHDIRTPVYTLSHSASYNHSTFWARHRIEPVLQRQYVKSKRFYETYPYAGSVNNNYGYANQRQSICVQLLNSTQHECDTLFGRNGTNVTRHWNRGHLAPFKDFTYVEQQLATNKLINIMPQHEHINGDVWQRVEDKVRQLSVDGWLTVCTGVYGVQEMRNSKGVPTELYVDGAKKQTPVPEIWFKMVVSDGNVGIVYVVWNALLGTTATEERVRAKAAEWCPDVVNDDAEWLQGRNALASTKKMYLWACKVEDFLARVDFLDRVARVQKKT